MALASAGGEKKARALAVAAILAIESGQMEKAQTLALRTENAWQRAVQTKADEDDKDFHEKAPFTIAFLLERAGNKERSQQILARFSDKKYDSFKFQAEFGVWMAPLFMRQSTPFWSQNPKSLPAEQIRALLDEAQRMWKIEAAQATFENSYPFAFMGQRLTKNALDIQENGIALEAALLWEEATLQTLKLMQANNEKADSLFFGQTMLFELAGSFRQLGQHERASKFLNRTFAFSPEGDFLFPHELALQNGFVAQARAKFASHFKRKKAQPSDDFWRRGESHESWGRAEGLAAAKYEVSPSFAEWSVVLDKPHRLDALISFSRGWFETRYPRTNRVGIGYLPF